MCKRQTPRAPEAVTALASTGTSTREVRDGQLDPALVREQARDTDHCRQNRLWTAAVGGLDFGLFRDHPLHAHSEQLFGVDPLEASSTESVSASTAENDPTSLVTVAKHLHARVVTASANAGPNMDMIAL